MIIHYQSRFHMPSMNDIYSSYYDLLKVKECFYIVLLLYIL